MIEGPNTSVASLPVSVEIKKIKNEEGEKGEEETERSLSRTGKNVAGLMTDDRNQG